MDIPIIPNRWADLCTSRMIVICLLGILLLSPATAAGETIMGQEYDVKIGFIYNFINFVTWPKGVFSEDSEPLILCLVSDNQESETIFKLDKTPIKGRTIKVVSYQEGGCVTRSHVIFFATQNKSVIRSTLNQSKGLSILTIGEVDGFTGMGGIINFFEESNRLRFEVNMEAVRIEGLKMSAQLLGSAQIVKQESE